MAALTKVSVLHRRALNQAMLHAGRAPSRAHAAPGVLVRALRSALRMSQAQLARRCGIPQPHIARLEAGKCRVQMETLRRIFDAMFCDLLVLPLARKRPGDALAERGLERPFSRNPWAERDD